MEKDNETLPQKATIRQVTNMLATSKNVLFPGHNHLLATSADDLTTEGDNQSKGSSAPVVSRFCLFVCFYG